MSLRSVTGRKRSISSNCRKPLTWSGKRTTFLSPSLSLSGFSCKLRSISAPLASHALHIRHACRSLKRKGQSICTRLSLFSRQRKKGRASATRKSSTMTCWRRSGMLSRSWYSICPRRPASASMRSAYHSKGRVSWSRIRSRWHMLGMAPKTLSTWLRDWYLVPYQSQFTTNNTSYDRGRKCSKCGPSLSSIPGWFVRVNIVLRKR